VDVVSNWTVVVDVVASAVVVVVDVVVEMATTTFCFGYMH
jgi:cyclic lactone autoinducer peptide